MANTTKFGRGYSLTCTNPRFPAGTITIELPFTLEFDIQRDGYPTNNRASLRLYNLSKEHRLLLTQDQWIPGSDLRSTIEVTLMAGYGAGPRWPIVFKGNTTRAWSIRQGVDFITTLEAFDGGRAYGNSYTKRTFAQNTPMQQIFEELAQDLVPFGVSLGVVSDTVGRLAKGAAFSGNTIDILRELTNSNFFIDNLKLNILDQTDAIGGADVLINADSGLLGTPLKEETWLSLDILFEPRLVVGSFVNIQSSSTLPIYNGSHKVIRIHHKGIISDAVCGEAITSLGCQSGIFETVTRPAGVH